MTALYDDDDCIAYELAQMDRATLLQMAQRRGSCVSDIALEVASRAAVARAAHANVDLASDLAQSGENWVRAQSRFRALQYSPMRSAA
jgi:hypothetical protein